MIRKYKKVQDRQKYYQDYTLYWWREKSCMRYVKFMARDGIKGYNFLLTVVMKILAYDTDRKIKVVYELKYL